MASRSLTHRNETVVRSRNHRANAAFSAVTRRPDFSSSASIPLGLGN